MEGRKGGARPPGALDAGPGRPFGRKDSQCRAGSLGWQGSLSLDGGEKGVWVCGCADCGLWMPVDASSAAQQGAATARSSIQLKSSSSAVSGLYISLASSTMTARQTQSQICLTRQQEPAGASRQTGLAMPACGVACIVCTVHTVCTVLYVQYLLYKTVGMYKYTSVARSHVQCDLYRSNRKCLHNTCTDVLYIHDTHFILFVHASLCGSHALCFLLSAFCLLR